MFNGLRKQLGNVLKKFSKQVETEPEVVEQAERQPKSMGKKIRDAITKIKLSEERFDQLFWDLELVLLQNNVATLVVENIKQKLKEELVDKPVSRKKLGDVIRQALENTLKELLSAETPELLAMAEEKRPFVILFVGVNGSGKTTTIAKICKLFLNHNKRCVMVASDTFRAAAIQQLEHHAKALGVKLIRHDYGSDPAAVAYDGVAYAKAHSIDVVLIDSAGRLHTNRNLMDELRKIKRVAKPDLVVYVGESITGNDCIEQAKLFEEHVGIDAIVLTKLDVDEKGGAALSIAYVTKKPIIYFGTGQGYEDLEVFDPEKIIKGLL